MKRRIGKSYRRFSSTVYWQNAGGRLSVQLFFISSHSEQVENAVISSPHFANTCSLPAILKHNT